MQRGHVMLFFDRYLACRYKTHLCGHQKMSNLWAVFCSITWYDVILFLEIASFLQLVLWYDDPSYVSDFHTFSFISVFFSSS